jgi:transposase
VSFPGGTPLARAQQRLVWSRQDQANALRSAVLEDELARALARHPQAGVLLSQPGLGVVLAARLLGEFGDDPCRYGTAK